MDKTALLNIDPATVGRFAVGGALAGGSAAALLNLMHTARAIQAERKRRAGEGKTDANTIVLQIPRKSAEVTGTSDEPHKIKVHESAKQITRLLKGATSKQVRHYSGEYGSKVAAHGWPTLTAASLAAIGGGTAGAMLVDKLYQVQREKQLRKELDLAKQEYMGALVGRKSAAALDELFGVQLEKTADDSHSAFGAISYPMAAAALLSVLGTAGTGYLTKKILDAKLEEVEGVGKDIPKVKRIVFQSTPEADTTKHASVAEIKAIKATFALMLDYVGGGTDYVGDEAIKTAAVEAGTTADELMKRAATDAQDTVQFLHGHPGLTDKITGKLFADSRVKRFMAQNPIGRHFVANRAGKMVDKLGSFNKLAQSAGAGGGSGAVGGNQSPAPAKLPIRKRIRMSPPWMKSGQDIGMMVGGKAIQTLSGSGKSEPEEIARAIADEQENRASEQRIAGMKEPGQIEIDAKGPDAEKYLNANQKRIVDVVKRLAAEGQL